MHLIERADMKTAAATSPTAEPAGLAGWLLASWRAWQGKTSRRPARRNLRHIETLALGGKRQLFLVECAGERFLVGSGAESVQTIVRVKPEPARKTAAVLGERC